VKNAVFEAGDLKAAAIVVADAAGAGQGQFRPLEGSDPYIGGQGEIETVREFRVETICMEDHLKAALSALRLAHPYEEPAIDLWRLEDLPG
jgi:hypothetical protein